MIEDIVNSTDLQTTLQSVLYCIGLYANDLESKFGRSVCFGQSGALTKDSV